MIANFSPPSYGWLPLWLQKQILKKNSVINFLEKVQTNGQSPLKLA